MKPVALLACAAMTAAITGTAQAQYKTQRPFQGDLPDYKLPKAGSDAGHVIFSVAGDGSSKEIAVFFRNKDTNASGWVAAPTALLFVKSDFKLNSAPTPPDISAQAMFYCPQPASGVVRSADLPPGRYEIVAIGSKDVTRFKNDEGLTYPFEITAGASTYIGAYRMHAVCQDKLIYYPHAWRLVVSDESARDLRLIRSRNGTLGEVRVQVPNPDPLGRAEIRSAP